MNIKWNWNETKRESGKREEKRYYSTVDKPTVSKWKSNEIGIKHKESGEREKKYKTKTVG